MRCIAAALLLVPLTASAQSAAPRTGEPPAATLPPIGLPLPPIGLPLAPLGLGPATDTASPRPTNRRPAPRRGPGRVRSGSVVYVLPSVPATPDPLVAVPSTAPATPTPAAGTLLLDVTPAATGEVFVDGYLVGRADEVNGALSLPAGPHRVEVRAEGYVPLVVDVRIEVGGTVTLRRTLHSEAPAPPATSQAPPPDRAPSATPAPTARKPFYFVPGCYMGDVPPKDAGLPASCDLSKTVVVRP